MYNKTNTNTELPQTMGSTIKKDQQQQSLVFLTVHNRENISTSSNKRTSVVIQTKPPFKYVLH